MQTRTDISPINYEPNRYADRPKADPAYLESETPLEGKAGRQKIYKTLDFKQAGERYRAFSEAERENLIKNLANDLSQVNKQTRLLAICNFYRADREYGERLAKALNIDISQYIPTQVSSE